LKPVSLENIAIRMPGIPSWEAAEQWLSHGGALQDEALHLSPTGAKLPPMERRRATTVTKLAIDVAAETLGALDASGVKSVFASSGGEVEIVHRLFDELSQGQPQLSPTQFHNSVHNTAAGYWSIATGSHAASESLCGFDDTVAIGLMEAVSLCYTDRCPVMLIGYDVPPLFPISAFRALDTFFAFGMLLHPEPSPRSKASLMIRLDRSAEVTPLSSEPLERIRLGNPAARILPLLYRLAMKSSGDVVIGSDLTGFLRVSLQCSP
jgi:hypothetical protein